METVIPPFLGHGHSRVMSWVVEEALEFFQTTQAVVKYSPAEGPWRDLVARMLWSLKLYVYDSKFAGLLPKWDIWLPPKPECPDERTLDLIRRKRFQFIPQILALHLHMPKVFHYSLA